MDADYEKSSHRQVLKPVTQRGAQAKRLRGKDMWSTRIPGLSATLIFSRGEFSRGAAAKKVVEDFKNAPKPSRFHYGEEGYEASHEKDV